MTRQKRLQEELLSQDRWPPLQQTHPETGTSPFEGQSHGGVRGLEYRSPSFLVRALNRPPGIPFWAPPGLATEGFSPFPETRMEAWQGALGRQPYWLPPLGTMDWHSPQTGMCGMASRGRPDKPLVPSAGAQQRWPGNSLLSTQVRLVPSGCHLCRLSARPASLFPG